MRRGSRRELRHFASEGRFGYAVAGPEAATPSHTTRRLPNGLPPGWVLSVDDPRWRPRSIRGASRRRVTSRDARRVGWCARRIVALGIFRDRHRAVTKRSRRESARSSGQHVELGRLSRGVPTRRPVPSRARLVRLAPPLRALSSRNYARRAVTRPTSSRSRQEREGPKDPSQR